MESSQAVLQEVGYTFFQTRCIVIALQKSYSAPTNSSPTAVSVGEEVLSLVPPWTNHVCYLDGPLCPGSELSGECLLSRCTGKKGCSAFYGAGYETQMWLALEHVLVLQLKGPWALLATRPA